MNQLPPRLAYLEAPARKYGSMPVHYSRRESSVDGLTDSQLDDLRTIFAHITRDLDAHALAVWLDENEPMPPNHDSLWQHVFNLAAIFEVLGRKRIVPFRALNLELGKKEAIDTAAIPEQVRFLAPLMARVGAIVDEKGELGAQKEFKRMKVSEKKAIRDAAAQVRQRNLYNSVILPYVGSLNSINQQRLYGLCGFWDVNGIAFM